MLTSESTAYRYGPEEDPIAQKPPTEAELTKQIRYVLKIFRVWHFKHWGGPMGEKGIADILGIYNGKFLAIEIKTHRGRVSPEQQRFLDNVNQHGGIGFVARSVEDVAEALGLTLKLG